MNEIIPNLWLGDLRSSRDHSELKRHKIIGILSVIPGKLSTDAPFNRYQIKVDDSWDVDIMKHFLPGIHFIQDQLDKEGGVLVHCQAGVSRSATIVAAYLIYTRKINPAEALNIIKQVRPWVDPNEGFLRQLDLFHNAQCEISEQDKDVRRYYLRRAVKEIKSGDGSRLDTEMMSNFPNSSSGSTTTMTPNSTPRRRIRCKMCRQELATHEHMLDHGQLGPDTRMTSLVITPLSEGTKVEHPSDSSKIDNTASAVPASGHQHLSNTPQSNKSGSNTLLAEESTTHGQHHEKEPSNHFESPGPSSVGPLDQQTRVPITQSPPILVNPKCSGYFVEPMKWMNHFLSAGELSGKITCPNKKCSAKLGNYDWAGVCCGCKEWVIPGFCINRSKVDEIIK